MTMGDAQRVAPRRGDVYLVNFDPIVGAEIQKTRPALILQNDIANRYSAVTIVAAISSAGDSKLYPTEVAVALAREDWIEASVVLLNQVRTIDKQRLVKKLGSLSRSAMGRVDAALVISFGLSEI